MSEYALFERTLALLHRAGLDDAYWLSAASAINKATGTTGHALGFGRGYLPDGEELFFARFCFGEERREDWERTYFRDYWQRDERLPILHQKPDGALTHTDDLYTESARKASPLYNEMLCEMRARNGLNLRLDAPGGLDVLWCLGDSIDMTGWTSDQVKMIKWLRPHIRHFLCVRQALVDANALGASLHGLLENTETGVIQLNRRGRVVDANDPARDILRQGNPLFAPGGFLRAMRPAENAVLQRLLAKALPPFRVQGRSGSMSARGASPLGKKLTLHVLPVRAELRDLRTRSVAALVLAISPRNPVWLDPHIVAEAFGLTRTESRLAVMLAAGYGVADIAAATGRRKRTIYWHFQQIFRKQGIAGQTELVRRLLSLQVLARLGHGELSPKGGRSE